MQLTLDNLNTQKLEHLDNLNTQKLEHLDNLNTQKLEHLDNLNTQKLEHLGRSNKFVGPLDEFLAITRTFPYLSEAFQ